MRVMVVDDNALWRSSLVSALTSRGITVVADAVDGPALWARLEDDVPDRVDVAVLDLRLPPTWSDEGIHLAASLRERMGPIGVMILSGYEHDVQLHYATRAAEELGSRGGFGYLFKDRASRRSLRDAIHRIARGRVLLDPIFVQQVVDKYPVDLDGGEREVAVLTSLLGGLTLDEIAGRLAIEREAVERAGSAIADRLGLPGAGDLDDAADAGRRAAAILGWLRRVGRTP